jgi:cell division protein ZapB
MSSELLQKLDDKIDNAIETLELLRLQNEELETKNSRLHEEVATLKSKQAAWEQNLTTMLEKLDAIDNKTTATTYVEREESVSA